MINWAHPFSVCNCSYTLHRSGQSLFTRPKPIDLSAPRRGGLALDIDMEDEEDAGELGRPLIRSDVVFDAGEEQPRNPRPPMHTDMPRAVQAAQERDDEDLWAGL